MDYQNRVQYYQARYEQNKQQCHDEYVARSQDRKDSGLCQQCGRPVQDNCVHCPECLCKKRKKRDILKTKGICTRCFVTPCEKGVICAACKKKDYDASKRRKDKRRSDGVCEYCGKPAINKQRVAGEARRFFGGDCLTRMCLEHYLRRVASRIGTTKRWKELLDLFDFQDERCALTGWKLTMGVDADLDHIVPLSKGGSHEISNLQWLNKDVNIIKRDLSEDYFLSIVKAISQHCGGEA